MDCLTPILDIGTRLWDCSSKHVAFIHNLEENLQKLRTEMEALNCRRHDVWCRVEAAEQQPRMRRTEEVDRWLESAKTMDNELHEIIQEGDQELQNKCVGSCCPKNLKSSYKIGKRIIKKISSVEVLLKQGEPYCSDSAVAVKLPRKRLLIPEWPVENTVGLDSTLERVWRCIEDENIRIIRFCGIGGVGKTTLLKKVSNEFHRRSHDFDAVIWAMVPRQENYIEKVQEVIRKKLEIPDSIWDQCSGEDEKGAYIFSVLKSKKFVLLLDNVWEQFNLLTLGIHPRNDQNQNKVIYTARSLGLSFDVEALVTIEVERLPPEQALSLFRTTVGESILSTDPDLSDLANTFVRRCGGLPLALLTVAGAMACRKNLREWRHTVELLHTHPSEIAGMGGYVFPLLKFSYDNLNEASAQNCFLYCSLFPEAYNIRIDELIDLWIGEGFLDGADPCGQGEYIVGTLKLAYLLESDESKQCVRMHDIVRHMALWLARDQGKNKNKVLVAKSGRITDQELTKWEEANWISLFGGSSRVKIDYSPSCHYLSTLLLRDAQLESFPKGFFDSMPALKVLDLSGNRGLVELPSNIGNVTTLRYLNLSLTSIAKLPTGLGNLRNLRCLLLDYTVNLKWIPKELISNLLCLQVYSKINGVTEDFLSVKVPPSAAEIAFLEVLECLGDIKKIGITLLCAPSFEKILRSCTLRSCIRKLTFIECTCLISIYFTEELSNLERLEIFHCSSLKQFKVSEGCKLCNLSKVYIGVCPLLLNLNCLAYVRNLEILTIVDCKSLKEVTSETMAFPGLKTISLTRLKNLKSICPSPSCFPSLLEIEVSKCPSLRQLPFDVESANFLQKIRGETEWWDGLVWDDEAVKDACLLKFISTPFELLQIKKDDAFPKTSSFKDGVQIVSQTEAETPPPAKLSKTDTYNQLNLEDTEALEYHNSRKEMMKKGKGTLRPNLKLFLPSPADISFPKFPTKSGSFKDGDLLVNKDGVRIVSQSEPEARPPIKPSEADMDNQLNLEDIDAIKVISNGNGRIVQLVQHKWTGQFFALKIIQMNIEESARKQIAIELKINQSSQCPYVVVCYQSFYTNGAISIILEYMDGGSLADFLKKVKSIPEPYLAAICKQVLKGLMYLHHEKHIIHRDLKPSKLLINHRGEVKITDFHVSAILASPSERANTFVGTYTCMSPERIVGASYGIKADIWSLGLVLLECATGKFPYTPPEQAEGWTNLYELMERIVEESPPCAPSEQFSPEFCSFISACLQKDPKERKSARELLVHSFLNMYDDLDVDLSSYFSNAKSPLESL
ncbi:Disease resistance protein RPS5, putative isoform 1 [Theobroma cacao]|uniref:mitogen-activated protein kinase kinase n=2 Tax=Theobroma cacao TaxID=3641 RepID=A0A061GLS6_THECC|nr:Disease resistance protein RPS5, putative isoform 1 [Theobroma cacao]